jgi:hypothetical protein
MRAVVVTVAIFAFLAFDITHGGRGVGTVTGLADDIMREIRHTLSG